MSFYILDMKTLAFFFFLKKVPIQIHGKRTPAHSPRPWHGAEPPASGEGRGAQIPPGCRCPCCSKFMWSLYRWKSAAPAAGIMAGSRDAAVTHLNTPLLAGAGLWSRRHPWKWSWPKALQVPSLRQPKKRSKANTSFVPHILWLLQKGKNLSSLTAFAYLSHTWQTLRSNSDPQGYSDQRITALDPTGAARQELFS